MKLNDATDVAAEVSDADVRRAAAGREPTVRSIVDRMRGLPLTREQAARIMEAAAISAATDGR